MNREEAKRILLAYRPGSQDAADEEVARALDLARSDAELKAWLDEVTTFQTAVRAQMRQLPVPAPLRDAILARCKVVRPLWRRPEFLLAAACLVGGLVLAALWSSPGVREGSFDNFRSRMVNFAIRVYQMDIVTHDLAQVRQYQRRQGSPADYTLAGALPATPVKGGASLTWQGHPVSMVCFDLPRNKRLYMFVMDVAVIARDRLPGAAPIVSQVRGVATASWTHQGKVYVVAAETDPAELERLVTGSGRQAGGVRPSVCIFVGAGATKQPVEIGALIVAQGQRKPCGIRLGRRFGTGKRPAMGESVAIGKAKIG